MSYHLHSKYILYQIYGNKPPQGRNTSPPPSPQSIYGQQKKMMRQEYSKLKGNKAEEKRLEQFLNLSSELGKTKISPEQKEERSKMFDELRSEISRTIGVKVTDTLRVEDEDVTNQARLKMGKEKLDKKVNQVFSKSRVEGTISQRELNRVVSDMEKVHRQIRENNITNENAEAFMAAYNTVKQYINRAEQTGNMTKRGGKSFIVKDFGEDMTGDQFIQALNRAQNLISYGNLSGKIGQIGEMFGAAAVFSYFNKGQQGYDEIMSQFVKSGFTKAKGVKVTGDDKTNKYFSSSIGKQYVSRLNKQATDENGNIYALNLTDDKVDFTIDVADQRKNLNFSMKNYSDASEITLLSGNIFPILDEYPNFLYHFLNLTNLAPSTSGANLVYQAAKITVAIKALIGGVRAVDAKGGLIKTPTADYLIINTNSRKNGIKVYSSRDICQQIESNVDKFIGFNKDFNTPGKVDKSGYDNRFASMHVFLRSGNLRPKTQIS